jgi:hypothetical protein
VRRLWLLAALLMRLCVASPGGAAANGAPPGNADPAGTLPPLCPPLYQLQHPEQCPASGPGGYALQLVRAGLPYRLPGVEVLPLAPYRSLTPDAYGRVITDTPGVYRHPLEALAGLPPLYRFEKGFVFVSLRGTLTYSDTTFYEINPGEFMFGRDLEEQRPSTFAGIHYASPPGGPIGWVLENTQLSAAPGQPPEPSLPSAGRYQPVTIFEVQRAGEWNWYLIGPGLWIEQRLVAVVQPAPPPGAGGNVIAVDTYEQTLGVYRNGSLIFATLISSGSRAFPTRPGTFQIWVKLTRGKMTGAYLQDRRDYYFLEDVPWILYYDGQRALHGSYWHDHYGLRGSHGCVNLTPRDARWLYDFANVGDTVVVFASGS